MPNYQKLPTRKCLKCGNEFSSKGDRICGHCNRENAGALTHRVYGLGQIIMSGGRVVKKTIGTI